MADLTPRTRSESFLNGEDLEPITRREHFYAGRESELPAGHQEPETREEWFIKKYREAGDVTVESLSITENGTYTAPSGKAYSPVSVNVPLPSNAYLLKSIEHESMATFADGTDNYLKSLEVAIEPQQDLHGYDSPWVGGSGKNKCPINESTITGSTFIVDTDINIASGTWTFSFESAVTTNCSLQITDADGNILASVGISNQLRAVTVTIDAVGKHLKFYGYTGTYKKIQIESGSTVTAFAPYSNICPISGWSTVDVTIQDDIDNPTTTETITIQLGDTYYGGKLDVVNGVLTLTDGFISNYNGETLPSTWISDRDVYAEGTTPTIGAEVVYELATPQTIHLTPTIIKSLQGDNNFFASTGEIDFMQYWGR